MNNKLKIVLIALGIGFLVLLVGSFFYQIWHIYQMGSIAINSSQTGVTYEVSGDPNTYSGNQTLSVKKGKYEIKAYGVTPGIYVPSTLEVEVRGNKTTNLDLKLDIDPKGYNQGGVEGP